MATISFSRPRLVGYGDGTDPTRVEVDTSGTTFVFNDLLTFESTSGIDKATSTTGLLAANTNGLALAAEPDQSQDPYYEPIPSGSGKFGDDSDQAIVVQLQGQQVEMSTGNEALATADLGAIFALGVTSTSATDTTVFVDLSTSSTSGFKIIRVADPVFGGDIGDTQTRVIGRFTDDLCL